MDDGLSKFGLTTGDKNIIYKILSAILNLGNIKFETSISNEDSCIIKDESDLFLNNAATLLRVENSELENALTIRVAHVGGQQIK